MSNCVNSEEFRFRKFVLVEIKIGRKCPFSEIFYILKKYKECLQKIEFLDPG